RHVFRRGRVLYLADRDGVPTDRRLVLTVVRAATGGAILRLEGVESRDEADALRGHTLLIRRSEAAPADREEIHFRDLVGLTALADGGQIGTVTDILEIAPGQTLVVRASDGREILIPF